MKNKFIMYIEANEYHMNGEMNIYNILYSSSVDEFDVSDWNRSNIAFLCLQTKTKELFSFFLEFKHAKRM